MQIVPSTLLALLLVVMLMKQGPLRGLHWFFIMSPFGAAAAFNMPAWSFGSGIRYVGESKDNPENSNLTVPSVTLLDIMASYTINDKWSAQLNINNAIDKEYISACDYYCYYGQSRSIVLSTKYRW